MPMEGDQYIAASGCAWPLLPCGFPPVWTVRYYFYRWRDSGLLGEINRALVAQARRAAGRDARPSTGVIDSQSVQASEKTSLSGFDAGKRIKGRKRHIITDTCGNLLACTVHSASIQDRDGASGVLTRLHRKAPNLRLIFADGGYAGPKLRDALVSLGRYWLQSRFASRNRHQERRLVDIQLNGGAILHVVSPPFLRLGARQPGASLERRMPQERPPTQSAYDAIMGAPPLAASLCAKP